MKKISLITGSDLRFVMGVNYFLKSFVECNDLFDDVKVTRVYSGVQTLKVDEGEAIPIGVGRESASYKARSGIRTVLRKLLTGKFYPFALFRYELNKNRVSQKAVEAFFSDETECDYIIFQELGVAQHYFKHCSKSLKTKNIKTMLVIHSEDDSGSMLLETFKGYGQRDMRRRFLKMRDYVYEHIDKVMYISRKAYENSILPENKKTYVYNGSPDVPFRIVERNDGLTQFVCVGSIEGRKGQDKIVEAMHLMNEQQLKKIHVTFVGDGSKAEEARNRANTYGLEKNVTFLGRRNDVPDILQSMDVFIMPSTVEGLPMSAIEAMRAGLYLILTDTGGNAELCANGCGLVCTREPYDIMKRMIEVINNSVVSYEQKLRCRKRFEEHFSLAMMAQGYEKTLKSM